MSAWMNDAVPNHNGNGFPHNMNDPSAVMMDPSAFMANPAQFNPAAQFAAQQQQMPGMPNGPMRNASPSFQTPVYQTNSVIPSKRPRPREDSLASSPRQNPGMLPASRSDTPQQQQQQQQFPGFQPGAVPQQNPAGQFPHLQANGSANASPSPIMGNQMRPGSVPQRVATASPHPFSPGAQQFNPQASPIPSEHGTPQPNPYMQNLPQGYNPNFAPSPSNPRPSPNPNAMAGGQMMAQQMGGMPQHMGQMPNNYSQMQQPQTPQQQQQQQQQLAQQSQQLAQQQRQHQQQQQQQQQRPQNMSDQQKMAAYQLRLQQQLQGNVQMQAHLQAQNMGRGMMAKQGMPGMPNGQVPQGGMRPQQRPPANVNPEHFMKNLTALMNAKGLPFDPNPMVGDRPVNLMMLFQAVQSKGGYKNVTTVNGWAHVAQSMGLPAQVPSVPQTLMQVYERSLYKFEEVWMAQQKHRMMQQQSANMAAQGTPQKQMQPGQQMNQSQIQPGQQPPHMQQQTPVKPGQQPVNGFSTPQAATPQQQQANAMASQHRNSMSRNMDPSAPGDFSMQSPAHSKAGSMSMPQTDPRQPGPMVGSAVEQPIPRLARKSDDYTPCSRELTTHGGIDLHPANMLGAELERWRPGAPPLQELGFIDIHALTKGLQSGIHGEVRVALDTLATVSTSSLAQHYIHVKSCEELMEALLDCAETQLDVLAEHTVEVSDDVQLTPYEDVVRACRLERWAVREIPAVGSDEYELDRAVEWLICVTTILRNLSMPIDNSDNHITLAHESVIKLLCVMIRYLGTRTMLLRTHSNTLDFMKDVVVLLSNVAGFVEVPGREQALTLLHFLLSFAPMPGPVMTSDAPFFTPYEPSTHAYLPHAVDCLAKLFARDEPNRTHYKTIFALDAASHPPHELLSRTFALAVSTIPDREQERGRPPNLPPIIEVRKPFLMQSLLAGEIIASLAPGPESGLAKAWLSSENGLAQNLLRLVRELSQQYEHPQMFNRNIPRGQNRRDSELLYIVVLAVTLLRRLAEKANDPAEKASSVFSDLLPSPQALMEATSMSSPEWTKEGYLQHMTALVNMAS